MPTLTPMSLTDAAIQQINSLGGPPLPTGVSMAKLKIILENRAASESPLSSCRIAEALATRSR